MKENSLNVYLDEIGQSSLLSEDEERRLSIRIKNGDERALNKLVEANLRFVVSIARNYQGRGLAVDDLISEGNIGLMKAARKFDGERGLRFVSYAVVFVRQQIEKALLQESDEMRVESAPTGVSRSVDAPLGGRANMSLLSVLTDATAPLADERVYSAAIADAVEYALHTLDEREKKVITAYFGIEQEHLTMAEIAFDMGLKRERIRQIRDRGLRRLKKNYKRRLAELR
ncbi:sigma-70 family RNA polymerase sigma factor [Prevotella sp. E9-3]|uniref:sigma-70 family RNA polymerase sigma factor n=1 Tax=Prevotella sp. E9-3 TaxID=2913621 RepID=UPI001EDA00C4|nr:sigma-70 family RNA polymerase sigma factor [Prevotella sp. E9-3]UKK49365.1 sigma-70 family RNA polymerase sigma factor [Prevotella sp. E9-3]